MSETRTAGSDGSNTVFATLSGMVGAGNAAGCWYLWKPAVGVTYDSYYQDSRVSIRAESETTYSLSTDGGKTISLRQYNPRWQSGRYYDAAGNAIASAGAANVTGLPVQVFFDPGVRAAQTTNNPNTNTNTGTDNTTTADQWTRGTDGSTDVWVSESGMVGKAVPGPWVWVVYKPTAGITYQSHYGGKTVSVQALGNGVYLLDVNGVQSRRVYDARWSGADFYTSTGAPAGSAAAAIASSGKDLSPAFFTPGPLAPNTNTNTGTDNTTTADQWTRGTDGSTDVWVSESGMVGKAVPGPWVWVVYKPTAGITYQSHYGGKTVSVQALGNGVYLLDVNGVQSRRVYDARWSGADFYTSTGAPAGSAAAAIASSGKDLSPAFFTPGPLAPNVTPPITPPVTPPITPPVTPPITPPVTPPITPPISTFPTGPGTGPYVPIPKTDQVVPIPGETPKSAGGVGKIALAALAAWAMFNS